MTPLETKLTAALRANLALIERAQAALTDYLADKDADPRETITRSLSVLDGPQQREAKMLAARGSGRGRRVASALKARAPAWIVAAAGRAVLLILFSVRSHREWADAPTAVPQDAQTFRLARVRD